MLPYLLIGLGLWLLWRDVGGWGASAPALPGGVGDLKYRTVTVKGIDDRLRLISQKIKEGIRDPNVRALAGDILRRSGVPERDARSELAALHGWVQENVRFTSDVVDHDTYQRAGRTLELKIGDCDDMAILLGSLLVSVGHPVWLKVIASGEHGQEYDHIYLLGGKDRFPLDPSVDRPAGWEHSDAVRSKVVEVKV